MPDSLRLFSRAQACALLGGISERQLDRLLRAGQIQYTHVVGSKRLFSYAEVDRFLREREIAGRGES